MLHYLFLEILSTHQTCFARIVKYFISIALLRRKRYHRDVLMPSPFAAKLVERNPIEPGSEAQLLSIHAWQRPIGRQESLLAKVLRQLAVLRQAIQHTPDTWLIVDNKRLERCHRTFARLESKLGLVFQYIHTAPSIQLRLNSVPLKRDNADNRCFVSLRRLLIH